MPRMPPRQSLTRSTATTPQVLKVEQHPFRPEVHHADRAGVRFLAPTLGDVAADRELRLLFLDRAQDRLAAEAVGNAVGLAEAPGRGSPACPQASTASAWLGRRGRTR